MRDGGCVDIVREGEEEGRGCEEARSADVEWVLGITGTDNVWGLTRGGAFSLVNKEGF
jgi:hypothetical protein